VGLAMAGNFLRAFFLSIMAASYGVADMSRWHDMAGMSILIFTSVTTWLVAVWLYKKDPQAVAPASAAAASSSPERAALAQRLAGGLLAAAVGCAVVTESWYAWCESGGGHYPTWTAALPNTGKFKNIPIAEESADILKYDAGSEVQWVDDQDWSWTAYWFRYHPKATGETVFQAHNPDRCLPATGFVKVADEAPFVAEANGIRLQVYPKQFSWKGHAVYVFWVVYANRASFPMEKAVTPVSAGPLAKARLYLANMWHGRRASTSEMESLETIIAGPVDYAAAQAGYVAALQKIIVPDAGQVALNR